MPLIAHNGFLPAFRYIIAHLRAGNSTTERIKRQSACSQVSQISLRSGFANISRVFFCAPSDKKTIFALIYINV